MNQNPCIESCAVSKRINILGNKLIVDPHFHTGPPHFMNNQTEVISVKEKHQNLSLEFKVFQDSMARFSNTSWEFDGELHDSEAKLPILVNSTFLWFNEITRQHDGVYTLLVKTCCEDSCHSSTGRAKLDVQCTYQFMNTYN